MIKTITFFTELDTTSIAQNLSRCITYFYDKETKFKYTEHYKEFQRIFSKLLQDLREKK